MKVINRVGTLVACCLSIVAIADGQAAQDTKVEGLITQYGGISPLHLLAPGAMGTTQPVASNETAAGRAENRRVIVKVLVNRGLAGQ